jgi:hypothetical protein
MTVMIIAILHVIIYKPREFNCCYWVIALYLLIKTVKIGLIVMWCSETLRGLESREIALSARFLPKDKD